MDQLLYALKNVMAEEKNGYQKLLQLSEKKKDVLIKNEVAVLSQIVREETNCIKALRPLSMEREVILKEIAQKKGITGDIDFETVISFTNGNERSRLESLKQEFRQVIARLQQLNELNQKLIDTQLQYTEFCIEALTQPEDYGNTYNNMGNFAESKKSRFGLIDRQA